MKQVQLSRHKGFSWYQDKAGISCKGYWVSSKNIYYSEERACKYLSDLQDQVTLFIHRISQLNGHFSIVVEGEDYILAAVDRLRSIPLFYTKHQDNYLISDEVEWLCHQVGNYQLDNIAHEEFKLLGYVTGEDTLYSYVKQLQAGNLLVVNKKVKTAKQLSYYDFQRGNFTQSSLEILMQQLDKVHLSVFKRLINSLEGRTALIPLSGGYDSRLIAIMLKRLNYEKVICFSYGKKDNWESNTSAKIAEYLNYPWHYINYNFKNWRNWYNSQSKKEFYHYSQYYTALPYIQDILAIKYLDDKKLIPNSAIFIPGHSGDFLAGSHVSYELLDEKKFSARSLIDAIYKYHYSFWRMPIIEKRQLFDHKFPYLEQREFNSTEDMSCAADLWDWQERQAKFIVNSVRAFEFYEYEWRLPLWDHELMEFWQHIPFYYRFQRKLYMQYVERYQGKINRELQLEHHGIEEALLKKPKNNLLNHLIMKAAYGVDYFYGYFYHRLKIGGVIPFGRYFYNYFQGADNAKGILTASILSELK